MAPPWVGLAGEVYIGDAFSAQPNGRQIMLPDVSKFLSTTKTSGVSVSFGFPLNSFKREPEETPDLAPHNLQPSLSLYIYPTGGFQYYQLG